METGTDRITGGLWATEFDVDDFFKAIERLQPNRKVKMDTVEVDRTKLMARVKENRDNHRELFLKAQENYRAVAIKELDAMLEEARQGHKIRRGLQLIEPQDHTSDYDRVLDMLEMSVNETITLDTRDFARYARDEWEWREQWTATNASYGVTG